MDDYGQDSEQKSRNQQTTRYQTLSIRSCPIHINFLSSRLPKTSQHQPITTPHLQKYISRIIRQSPSACASANMRGTHRSPLRTQSCHHRPGITIHARYSTILSIPLYLAVFLIFRCTHHRSLSDSQSTKRCVNVCDMRSINRLAQ